MRINSCKVRLLGDILKRSVAAVVVKKVPVHPRNKDVGIPIVVIICNGNSHGIAFTSDSGFFGYIGERAVTIVAKKTVPVFRTSLLERWHGCSVGKENIHAAVVVVIESGYAAEHQFRLVKLANSAVVQLELEPRFRRNLFKANLRQGARHAGEQKDQRDSTRR